MSVAVLHSILVDIVILSRLLRTQPNMAGLIKPISVSLPVVLLSVMADVQSEAPTQPELLEAEEPLLSSLDIFLFSLIAGLLIYWFIFRKKPEPIPEFKKLETP